QSQSRNCHQIKNQLVKTFSGSPDTGLGTCRVMISFGSAVSGASRHLTVSGCQAIGMTLMVATSGSLELGFRLAPLSHRTSSCTYPHHPQVLRLVRVPPSRQPM